MNNVFLVTFLGGEFAAMFSTEEKARKYIADSRYASDADIRIFIHEWAVDVGFVNSIKVIE